MMQQRQKWIQYIHIKSLKSMARPSLINTRKLLMHLKATSYFCCEYDGRHKARLVADGHLTLDPFESTH